MKVIKNTELRKQSANAEEVNNIELNSHEQLLETPFAIIEENGGRAANRLLRVLQQSLFCGSVESCGAIADNQSQKGMF